MRRYSDTLLAAGRYTPLLVPLILLSALAYGVMPILAKVAYAEGLLPAGLLAYRFLVASALFSVTARPDRPALSRRRHLVL